MFGGFNFGGFPGFSQEEAGEDGSSLLIDLSNINLNI